MAPVKEFCIKNQHSLKIDKIDLKTQEICRFILQKGCNSGRKKKAVLTELPFSKALHSCPLLLFIVRRPRQIHEEQRQRGGRHSQVKPLIPTAENGLFSRQVFYYMPAIHHWQNQFDRNDSDLEDTFKALGMEWKDKLKTIVMNGIFTLHLTDGQKDEFNRLFSRLFIRSGLANGNEMSSSVARLAINICRIMEVVAMLRAMEQGEITASPYVSPDPHTATDNLKDHIVSRWDLLIASDDFHAVLSLAESLYRHTTHILSFLPNTEVTSRGNADRDALVDSMEEEFTRASFLQKAGEMGIKSETASTWLKRMQKHGLVENVDGKGNYRKPKV